MELKKLTFFFVFANIKNQSKRTTYVIEKNYFYFANIKNQ